MTVRGQRIAVIGSGVSGLSSAWLLQYHGAEVTLYESEERCGGHTLTDHSSGTPVDLGFQVYNLTTYPHFVSWLEHLGVDSEASDMSFAISVDDGKLEWASHGLNTIFAQRKNLFDMKFLRMVREVLRFGREAPAVLLQENAEKYREVTLGKYLASKGYSAYFRDNYVVPMCAAVWSVPYTQAEQFPVQMLVRFWVNHHLLDILQRPLWRVVKGRSKSYVAAVLRCVHRVLTSTPVKSVQVQHDPDGRPQAVVQHAGGSDTFDRVVLATHSNISRQLRGDNITTPEATVLDAVPYAQNDVYLHRDKEYMPRTPACWASWNVISTSRKEDHSSAVCVSYGLHRLQHLPDSCTDLFVTLNPPKPPRADTIINRLTLAHPVFSMASWHAQRSVPDIQGSGSGCIYYAGAWCGYGFHEDGMRAAVAALNAMDLSVPWNPRPTSPKMSVFQGYIAGRLEKYLAASIGAGSLRVVRPDGYEYTVSGTSKSETAGAMVHAYDVVPAYTPPQAFDMGSTATEQAAAGAPLDTEGSGKGCVRMHAAHQEVDLRTTVRTIGVDAFMQVARFGSVGLIRGYRDRQWEVVDIGALALILMLNLKSLADHTWLLGPLQWLGCTSLLARHMHESRSVDSGYIAMELLIDEIGTDCFRKVLDPDMHLTPAVHRSSHKCLWDAHVEFSNGVLAASGVSQGCRVLEVGGGWGAIARHAVNEHRCKWISTFLSRRQMEHCGVMAQQQDLTGFLSSRLCDWQELPSALPATQRFDAIVAVDPATICGIRHGLLQSFFEVLACRLAAAGKLSVLAFYASPALVAAERRSSSFFKNEVLRGAELPTRAEVAAAATSAGLTAATGTPVDKDVSSGSLGGEFAATMRQWRLQLTHAWHACINAGATDEQLRQMELSFALMEAALELGHVQCELLTYTRTAAPAGASEAEIERKTHERAMAVTQARLAHQASVSRPVSSEATSWLQALALMLLGLFLSYISGWSQP